MATVPLRLYATRGTGQQKAGMRGGIGKSIGRTISKAERAELTKGTAGQSARFRAAEDIEEISLHPFLDIWGNSFFDRSLLALFGELTGNSYLAWGDGTLGTPEGLTVLPSQYVKPIVCGGEIVAYEFGQGITKVRIPAENMAHTRFPNPCNNYVGLAPLSAAAMAADRDVDMDIYEGSLNANHGRPDFAVILKDGGDNKSNVDAYAKEWKAKWAGVANSGRPMFTGGDVDIKNLGFSPREMAFLQGRKLTADQIFAAFDIPAALARAEGVNRATMETSVYMWHRFGILPRLRMSEAVLNEQLIVRYNEPRLFVAYDNPVESDREFEMKKTDTMIKNYTLTINEARNAEGLESVDWGDVPLVPSSGLEIGTIPQATAVPVKSVTKAVTKTGDPDDAPSLAGGANPGPNAQEKKIMAVTDKMQTDQQRDLMGEFDRVAVSGSYDSIKYAPQSYATKYLDDAVDAMTPAWERGLRVGNIALPDGSKIDVGAFIDQPQAQEVVSKNTLKFLNSEGETVGKDFRSRLSAGIKDGDSIPELRKRIDGMFGTEERNARSLMIARTESARAIELGREASWAESGVVTAKQWDANGDACPFCQSMHGKIVGLSENYFKMGETLTVDYKGKDVHLPFNYGDTPAPPLHPNCRCVLEPVFIDADG
jgi:HK97 family phage portal protein